MRWFLDWHRRLKKKKNQIFDKPNYYTISSIPIIADIFLPIYLFMLGWKLIEVGVLISYSFIVSVIGSIIFGKMLDIGFQPKWAMLVIDFSSTILYLIYAFAPRVEYIFEFRLLLIHGSLKRCLPSN